MQFTRSLAIAKALADRSRLLILKTLSEAPLCSEELAAKLDLAPSTVSFHLKKLTQAGLLHVQRDQYYTTHTLAPESLRITLGDLLSFTAAAPESPVERRRQEDTARIGDAFFAGGKLARLPVQRRKRSLVLEHFASLFAPERAYDETAVNDVITPHFDDYCLLRRLLVDEGYLERTRGIYRRTDRPAQAHLSALLSEEGDRGMSADEQRRRLKEEYKTRKRVAGVFRVANTGNGRVFLGSCLDAERPLRRMRFELQLGSFRNQSLQRDFTQWGEDAFRFEVVETVPADAEDISDRLEQLEMKHLAALDRDTAYNENDRIRFR